MTTGGCLARDDLRLLRAARAVGNTGFDLTLDAEEKFTRSKRSVTSYTNW